MIHGGSKFLTSLLSCWIEWKYFRTKWAFPRNDALKGLWSESAEREWICHWPGGTPITCSRPSIIFMMSRMRLLSFLASNIIPFNIFKATLSCRWSIATSNQRTFSSICKTCSNWAISAARFDFEIHRRFSASSGNLLELPQYMVGFWFHMNSNVAF